MKLSGLMVEIADQLRTIPGLAVVELGDVVRPPGAFVALPDSVNYDETYERGQDSLTLPVVVLVGNDQLARLVAYADGDGPHSVKAAIERHTYSHADTVSVASVEFDTWTVADVELPGAEFSVQINGPGGA